MEGLLSFQPYSLAAYNSQVSLWPFLNFVIVITYVLDQHETLAVRDDLRSVQSLLKVGKKLLLVSAEGWLWAIQKLGSAATLLLQRAQAASKDGLADQSHGHAKIQSIDGCPFASALLTGRVQNLLDQWLAVIIVKSEHVASDFDQEGIKNAFVPFLENVGHLFV